MALVGVSAVLELLEDEGGFESSDNGRSCQQGIVLHLRAVWLTHWSEESSISGPWLTGDVTGLETDRVGVMTVPQPQYPATHLTAPFSSTVLTAQAGEKPFWQTPMNTSVATCVSGPQMQVFVWQGDLVAQLA